MKKLFEITARVLLVILSISLLIILIEAGLRITNYKKRPSPWRWATGTDKEKKSSSLFKLHPQRIYSLNENINNSQDDYDEFWATDGFGFRYNPSHRNNAPHKKPSVSIVMVGDSFTYGHGVKHFDSFPALIEKNLQKIGKNVIVHNAGIPGYGLDQEFLYIRDELIPKHNPDMIVWNLSVNDIDDDIVACLFKEKEGAFKQISAWHNTLYLEGLFFKHAPQLLQNSMFLNMLLNFPKAIVKQDHFTIGCTPLNGTPRKKLYEQISEKVNFFFNVLEETVKEKNIKIIITLIPYQLYFDENVSNDSRVIADYHRLRKIALSSNLKFINSNQEVAKLMKPGLLAYRNSQTKLASLDNQASVLGEASENLARILFLDDDFPYGLSHLNESGNQLLAGVVSRELQNILEQEK